MGENSLALKLFNRLSSLSPTQGACINSIRKFALGGGLTVNRKQEPGFSNDDISTITESESSRYIQFLKGFTSGPELLNIAENLYYNAQENGNMWLQVIMTQTAGVRSFSVKALDQLNVRYAYAPVGADRYAYVSPEWTTTYTAKNPPVLIPVYPLIGELETGVFSTLIHSANLTTDRKWYGVPESVQSIYFQWLEVMRGDYAQKEYGNGFTGKHFIEVEGDVHNSDISELASNFQRAFSRSGSAKNLVLRQRSVNQAPARVYSFRKNSDESYQKFTAEDAEKQIIKSHDWAGALIGVAEPGKLGESSYIETLYKWKFQTVVKPWQMKIMNVINQALTIAAQWLQNSEAENYELGLSNPMLTLLEQENGIDNGI
jgi:hypothetical protein